uniref:Uncharacterized protein n=1 Tax=Skeletonema marinoi TaxID=267567 RepID=A0A7S2PLR3_9STRA
MVQKNTILILLPRIIMKRRNVHHRHHRRRSNATVAAASSIIIYLCMVAFSSHEDELSIIPAVASFERKSVQRSRTHWRRRSRLLSDTLVLRGGIDEETEEEKEPEHTSDPVVVDPVDVIANVTISNSTVHDDHSTIASSPSETDTHTNSKSNQEKQTGGGGVVGSVVSWFRGPAAALNDQSSTKTSNQIDNTDKIPHGPDGRGGGGAIMTSPSTESDDESSNQDSEFERTSDVAVEEKPTDSNKSKPTKKDAIKSGDRGTAFVVPHHPKKHRKADHQPEHDDSEKSKKRSKAKKDHIDSSSMPSESVEESTNASKTAGNETESLNINATLVQNTTTTQITQLNESAIVDEQTSSVESQQDHVSSGYWVPIDILSSFGLSTLNDDLKLSRVLRPVRKAVANVTGLHGFVSGKIYTTTNSSHAVITRRNNAVVISIDEELGIHDAGALEAEMLARRVARQRRNRRNQRTNARGNRAGRRWFRRGQQASAAAAGENTSSSDYVVVTPSLDSSPDALEQRRRERVEEIDHLLQRGGERLLELQCERDDLLQAPNPLFNYTKKYDPSTNQTFGDVRTVREFNFPPSSLVNEYIGELVSNARLIPMNHTQLWSGQSDSLDDDDDESVGDDLLTPSADARKLYENLDQLERGGKVRRNGNGGGGGSWLLRTGFGRNGGSLGEKLGETIETAAYKGVCSAIMMVLARLLSCLHGVNIMGHSDIRVYIEGDPDLPPVNKKFGENYAEETLKRAIRKGSRKKKKRHSSHRSSSTRQHGYELSDDAFIQRDAVVETLISHCQISAPLLKLFPLDWQRAMVGNIITLVTAIVSDFADGLQFQILGHALSVSFKPITEADMFQQIGVGGFRHNHRRTRPDEFEAAVMATAQDISDSLSFLDGWLEWAERRVGGGVLRSQIGNLIARVVLTLVDEVLSGAKLDLWSSQANGPRLYAALEYRDQSETHPSDE